MKNALYWLVNTVAATFLEQFIINLASMSVAAKSWSDLIVDKVGQFTSVISDN